MGRIQREKRTVSAMIHLYCQQKHQSSRGQLCSECQELNDYAMMRLDRCKFGEQKTTCGKCPVHCYKPAMREKIVSVMRFAGPKMVIAHPFMALQHLIDGFLRPEVSSNNKKITTNKKADS